MKQNPTTQPNTKYLCGPKRQTHNLKKEAMESVSSSNTTKTKTKPFNPKSQTQQTKNTTQQWRL